ncbi:MAG: orotidine-5'-phosphate decarboxylase [Bacteroidota bacterium]|nr:orotidine-5'-phosphate decarboxylase [Bacteroidota bacterium]
MQKDIYFLANSIKAKRSFLCVGIDPDLSKVPDVFKKSEQGIFDFSKAIIDATCEFAIAYKINVAFFEQLGAHGWEQLEKIVNYIPKNIFVIADAKRADIGNTSTCYAKYYFEDLQVDAVTLHPYMGVDSLEPFSNYPHKFLIILALTSNKGHADFQMQKMANGKYLYEEVIHQFQSSNYAEKTMFVVGATQPEHLKHIRDNFPDPFFLVPGIGAQGGNLQKTIEYGQNKLGGLLINVSRNIIYPEGASTFESNVNLAAKGFRDQMSVYF